MATRTWNKERASKRIDSRIAELPLTDIEIKDYVRETDLTNLPRHVAYRIDGVHLYADILNLTDMLHVTEVEGETCHRRTLRFLNLGVVNLLPVDNADAVADDLRRKSVSLVSGG